MNALTLPQSAVVAMTGDLGAGKTTFVRSILDRLYPGMGRQVVSPTFILHAIYETPDGPVHHLDWYRLNSESEILSLGWEDIFALPFRAVFIEWAEKFPRILPPDRYDITFCASAGRHEHACVARGNVAPWLI